ncbi:putative transporter svop-1 [Manduca sexta]|nr:putative transporter svop-1 [Manduca sexta]KAG6448225.1 hypothetical protein O3G_MSEX005388 [Manduca sexta]
MERDGECQCDKTTCSYDEAVELTGHGKYNYLLLLACCVIMNAVSMDMFGFSVIVTTSSCDLQLSLTEIGVLASTPFAGVVLAYPWGYYADTRGRKKALILSSSVGFVFAVMTSLATSWQFMFVAKFLASSFSSAGFTLTVTLLGECTGQKHRSQFLFILNSVNLAAELVYFGLAYVILPLDFAIATPLASLTLRSWRLLTFILALPLGFGALMMVILYESPKFLANRGDIPQALEVLKKMYERNGGVKGCYKVRNILTGDDMVSTKLSFWDSLVKQTLPIFRPPLLWKTLQLFYLLALLCSANNVFIVLFPTIVNEFFSTLDNGWTDKTFCERLFTGNNYEPTHTNYVCDDKVSNNTIYSGMAYGLFFWVLTLVISTFARRRKLVLMGTLALAGISCCLVNLKEPISNLVFFILLQSTCVGIGSIFSYFVDMYPTSYRGLATGLALMFARQVSFVGVNIITAVITHNCSLTFYSWAVFIFSGIFVGWFLPADTRAPK